MTPGIQHVRIPYAGGTLDGEWRPGTRGGAVVAPPHPQYGGARTHPVVQRLAEVLAAAGRATVAFDWRGVGVSDGRTTGTIEAAVEDYSAAAALLATRMPGPWIAAGYSFGAAAALRVAATDPAVAGLLLVAPPVAMMGTDDLVACAKPLGVVVGNADDIAPAATLDAALSPMPAARLEVLPGTDHFFLGAGLDRLREALVAVCPAIT